MEWVVQAALAAGIAVVSLVVLFLLGKLMGTKQVSQMTPFDYIVGITIGSIAGEMATQPDRLQHTLPSLVIYGLAAVANKLQNRSL